MKHAGDSAPATPGGARSHEIRKQPWSESPDFDARPTPPREPRPDGPVREGDAGTVLDLDNVVALDKTIRLEDAVNLRDPLELARSLPPLRRAEAFASRAIELAEQAEWEAGVARQSLVGGDADTATRALDGARRRVSGAQFLAALMTTALESYGRGAGADGHRVPTDVRRLAGRAQTAVQLAASIVRDVERSIPPEPAA